MVKVFGEKIDGYDYPIRKGVYAICFNSTMDKVLTVRNSKGDYFLPGGGIENGEDNVSCLEREMLEETGFKIAIGPYIGNAMKYFKSTKDEPLLNNGYFYLIVLSDKVQEPIEEDHYISWIDMVNAEQLLIHEHHYWAIKEGLRK
ncbi:NUDIX hydrolase [Lederbergia panacisoli]|uniref:NUDIX hydrolase n=1 Tax=Lederbergia panacisoli TaxID=1255251 RepID=UPI00214BC304|nr:NUDIX domain-containing protein [Lederbergia panacisoli]MCR2823628.1 NUDIX domain-containing protein [Lederbergia panacisoli]